MVTELGSKRVGFTQQQGTPKVQGDRKAGSQPLALVAPQREISLRQLKILFGSNDDYRSRKKTPKGSLSEGAVAEGD